MMRWLMVLVVAAWAGAAGAQGGAQPRAQGGAEPGNPAWAGAWAFMVQAVCADAQGRATVGETPLDGCARPRKLRVGEALPYHKRDWPGVGDGRAEAAGGYQQSDSVPVDSAFGPAAMQTFDFGDARRAFGRMDGGDGGQVVFLTGHSVSVGVTEDGGAGLQLFLAADCRPVDGWVLVDRSFVGSPAGQTVARLTRRADTCARRQNLAFTQWHVEPVEFRVWARGRAGRARWDTLVTEHFDAGEVAGARAMERMYFTQPLGFTRWEAWEETGRRADAAERAARLAGTGRCEAQLPPPAPGWAMTDCREWTRLVPAERPDGDPPFSWLDRLRAAPATAALFPPAR